MKLAIFGLGYVGVTTMACCAHQGHSVIGIDINKIKVEQINNGLSPIVEAGIQDMLRDGLADGRVIASAEIGSHLDDCDLAIVCVGTPSGPDGSHNMSYIADVTREIAAAISQTRSRLLAIAYRSTFTPGTMQNLIQPLFAGYLGKDFSKHVELIYNPEFLRESSAVHDFFNPPKIVVGTSAGARAPILDQLNQGITAPVFYVKYNEAEFTKFVDNAWHAAKITFANEIGRLCMKLGLSAQKIHEIFVSDTKLNISSLYLRPGGPFGGSCLPKDVRALQFIAAEYGAGAHLVESLIKSNEVHKYNLLQKATSNLATGAKILLVGLAFKEGTDDLRESPNVDLARNLLRDGFKLSVYDPSIDTEKLLGANLGYAQLHMPGLAQLLVSKEDAQSIHYDRVIVGNSTVSHLSFTGPRDTVNFHALL